MPFRVASRPDAASTLNEVQKDSIHGESGQVHSRYYLAAWDQFYFWLYRLAVVIQKFLPKKKLPSDRPLRVFRLTAVIAQGGVAKVCLQTLLATDPKDAQIHLTVFNSTFRPPETLIERDDIELKSKRLNIWPGSYSARFYRNLFRLTKRIRRFKPDVIHVHEPQYAAPVRIASIFSGNAPVFVHLHNDYQERWKDRTISDIQKNLMTEALKKCELIACSRTIREAGARWLDLPVERIHLIEDGADDVRLANPTDRLTSELPEAARGRQVIVKMSHIVEHKRIDDFLAACRILLDEGRPIFALLMCYGSRAARRVLCRQFECTFAPWEGEILLHVADPQALLKHCSVGVSASALEGLGLNILEFQMAGLPVVCTDLQPHREMIEHGQTGLLYEVGDVAQLVGHLRNLLDNEPLRQQLGRDGLASASKRTWKKTATNTLDLYRQVLADGKQ